MLYLFFLCFFLFIFCSTLMFPTFTSLSLLFFPLFHLLLFSLALMFSFCFALPAPPPPPPLQACKPNHSAEGGGSGQSLPPHVGSLGQAEDQSCPAKRRRASSPAKVKTIPTASFYCFLLIKCRVTVIHFKFCFLLSTCTPLNGMYFFLSSG